MSPRNAILIIFILAIIPRFMLAFSSQRMPTHDDIGYEDTALSILKDGVFGFEKKPTSFKPPLYPYFLAFVYRVFGHSHLAVRIIQSLLGALTCIIIYLIAEGLINKNVAFIAGLLGVCNISFIKSSELLLSEVVSTFLISLIILFLVKLRKASNLNKRMLLGLFSGLLALTRSETVFLLPLVYGVWLFLVYLRKYPLRLFMKDVVVSLSVLVCIVLIWTYRNWKVQHAFVPITTSVGINLYSSYCPPQGKLFGLTSEDEIVKSSLKINNEVERSNFLVRKTFKFICSNLDKLPRLEMLKLSFFWSIFDWEILGNGVYNFSFGFMLPFFLWGFIASIKDWQRYFLLYTCVIYFQIMALLLYGSPRFRIPCEPFIIIFAASGILHFYEKFSKKIFPYAAFIVFLSINIGMYFYSTELRSCFKSVFINLNLW